MKKLIKYTFFTIASLLFFNTQTFAASVELEWENPDNYTDLEVVNMGQESFNSMVFRELGEQFEQSASRFLEEGQTLSITVTDIDLAGKVDYDNSNTQRQRILRGYDFPAMSFRYEIKDENGRTISSGEENIKALNLKSVNAQRYDSNDLHHERSLINDWFVDNF